MSCSALYCPAVFRQTDNLCTFPIHIHGHWAASTIRRPIKGARVCVCVDDALKISDICRKENISCQPETLNGKCKMNNVQ